MPCAEQVAQQLQHLCQGFLLSQLPEQARPAALAAAGGAAQDAAYSSEQDDEMHEADVQQCTTTVPQGEALLLVFQEKWTSGAHLCFICYTPSHKH